MATTQTATQHHKGHRRSNDEGDGGAIMPISQKGSVFV